MEKFTLTKIIESKDEIDQEIISSTINMIAGLKLGDFILDKKSSEKHFGCILEITQSLLKANSHRRKYLETEKKLLAEFRTSSLEDKNTADLGLEPLELNTETEAVLSQIKSALDSLAKSFNPVLGLSLHAWHKKGKESGREVINSLKNNTPKVLKEKIGQLIQYIEPNIPWLSYIVWLRDAGQHDGGIKTITDIKFQKSSQKVFPQLIMHSKEESEEESAFLTRLIKEITQFINGCIAISLIIKAPSAMGIQKNPNSTWPTYSWFINYVPTPDK